MKLLFLYILKPDLEEVWKRSSDIWTIAVFLEDSIHLGFKMVALKKKTHLYTNSETHFIWKKWAFEACVIDMMHMAEVLSAYHALAFRGSLKPLIIESKR